MKRVYYADKHELEKTLDFIDHGLSIYCLDNMGKPGYEAFHDYFNKMLGFSISGGSFQTPCHEMYFLRLLYKTLIVRANNEELARMFILYLMAYFPECVGYHELYSMLFEPLPSISFLGERCYFQFLKKYLYEQKHPEIRGGNEKSEYNKAFQLGVAATDFCIRYLGYSLIKVSGEKVIVTARNDCDKRFRTLIEDGYSIEKRRKVRFIQSGEDDIGYFEKMNCLPTKGVPIDEIIEDEYGGFHRVLQKYD